MVGLVVLDGLIVCVFQLKNSKKVESEGGTLDTSFLEKKVNVK